MITTNFNPYLFEEYDEMQHVVQNRVFTYITDKVTNSVVYGANKATTNFKAGFFFGEKNLDLLRYWFSYLYTGNYYDFNTFGNYGFYRVVLVQGQEVENWQY